MLSRIISQSVFLSFTSLQWLFLGHWLFSRAAGDTDRAENSAKRCPLPLSAHVDRSGWLAHRSDRFSVCCIFSTCHETSQQEHTHNLLETASLLFVMVCFLFPQMSQLCLNRERERWEDTRADKRAPGEPSLQIITPAPGLFTYLVAGEATSCFCRHGRYFKDQLCVCLEKRLRADLSWDTRQQSQTGRRQSKSPSPARQPVNKWSTSNYFFSHVKRCFSRIQMVPLRSFSTVYFSSSDDRRPPAAPL